MLFQRGILSPKWSCLQKKTFSFIEILFTFCRIYGESNAEKRGGNRKKGFYDKMYENAVSGEGPCENPVGLCRYESHVKTGEYIWLNIEKLQDYTPSA